MVAVVAWKPDFEPVTLPGRLAQESEVMLEPSAHAITSIEQEKRKKETNAYNL
jgi:hypothetical protein